MRLGVLLSFLLRVAHCLSRAFSSLWAREDLRVYKIELIRPPVEEIDAEREADADLAKSTREEKPPSPEENQDTISLDTTDKRYVDYARAIKEQILSRWKYPTEAKDNLIEGKLLVVFSLGMHGEMKEIRVAEPSGHQILDAEATRAIRRAPFLFRPRDRGSPGISLLTIESKRRNRQRFRGQGTAFMEKLP
jgi:TonB family protein